MQPNWSVQPNKKLRESEVQFGRALLASNVSNMTIRDESIRLSFWAHDFIFYGLLNPQSQVNSVKSTDNTCHTVFKTNA
jgi:hypothetical protein